MDSNASVRVICCAGHSRLIDLAHDRGADPLRGQIVTNKLAKMVREPVAAGIAVAIIATVQTLGTNLNMTLSWVSTAL